MKILSLTLFFAFICSFGFGQISIADSLKNELAKVKHDTAKVLIYAKLVSYRLEIPRDEKIEFGQKGYFLAKKIHFVKGIILCGNDLGFIMIEKDYFKALPILFDVKQNCERFKDTTNLALSIGYIAYAYNKFNITKSLYYYRICLNLMQKAHVPEAIMPIYTAMGYAFKDNGDLDSALIYLKKGYQSSLAGNSPITVKSYDVNFGEIYYKKGDIALAMQYFKKSILNTDESNVGQSFYFLAKIYKEQNKLDSAKYFAKQSLMYEQKDGRSLHVIYSSQLLYDLYKNSNPKEALHYLEISSATKDSLFSQEKARQIEKFSFEEQERQTINQRRMEARQLEYENKIKLYLLLVVLLGLGILTFFLYRNNRKKHHTNTILQDKNKEIETTLSTLKSTQAQLIQSEKLASLGELTAGIAHEIQNPLNFVNNFAEMSVSLANELKEEVEKPEIDRELIIDLANDLSQNQEKINLHGKRASSIVTGMLEHSRTSTGERVLTDINKLADEYLRLSYHGLRAKDKNFNSNFQTDFDENLPKINIIPQDIGRVLLNIINNAFQSSPQTPDGGLKKALKVVVTTKFLAPPSGAGGAIIVSVTDNGTGMSEATKAKIFQPFFTTKPTGQGTGLGLSLAYDIVTKGHGGTIECESVEGEGTTFIVKLPIINN